MFRALPARCGDRRAARVLAAVADPTGGPPEDREAKDKESREAKEKSK
jgi:hypothetical protein